MDYGASSYRRFLNGDDNGFVQIVKDYKDGLMFYINSYVNNVFIAEELTEDTFFRLLTKKPRFNGKSTFKTWLYAIGRNITIDHIRHSSKLSATPVEEMENRPREEEGPELSYIKEERKIILHKTLLLLPADYRAVLWLVFFEGFSSKETAMILKKNSRQLKNLLYRAKKSLRSVLEKEGFVYEEL